MSNTEQHLKRIQEKLQLLLKEHTAVVKENKLLKDCLLYTSDAADERSSVDLGGRRIIKKKKKRENRSCQYVK